MKKIISFCLAAVLLLSFQGVFADSTVTEKQKDAILLLNGLHIFQDVSEENGANSLTRAEFAKIIARLMGGETGVSGKRIFTDVLPDHEAASSIEFLYNTGVMNGYGGAEFRPDGVITLEEAVKVVVEVIGYSNRAQYEGGWSTGYYSMAASAGLLKGVPGKNNEPLTYASAAILIQNVLENDKFLVVQGYKDGEPLEKNLKGQKYMEHMLGIYKYTGIVEGVRNTSLSGDDADYGTEKCTISGESFLTNGVDAEKYLGMKVNAYYHKDERSQAELLYISVHNNTAVVDVLSEDIVDAGNKNTFEYYAGEKVKKLSISPNAVYVYNGKALSVVGTADLMPEEGSVRFIGNNGNGQYDVVIIKDYQTFVVDKVIATEEKLLLKYEDGSLEFGGDTGIIPRYYLDGAETDFSSISAGSVVSVGMSKNLTGDILAEVLVSNNKVTGKAKSISNQGGRRKFVLDDDSAYELNQDYIKRLEEQRPNVYLPELGQEGTFYIDCFNRLAAYSLSVAGKNYAYIVKCAYNDFTEKALFRIFTKDGEFLTLEAGKKLKLNGYQPDLSKIKEQLAALSPEGTVNQLVIYETNSAGEISELKTAENKSSEIYYIAGDEEFVYNKQFTSKRFYKNMAEHAPFTFVDNRSIRFMIPTDKNREKDYKIETKLPSTDVSIPGPIYIYDAGVSGIIGAMTSATSVSSYSDSVIIDEVIQTIDEDGAVCRGLNLVGGTSLVLSDEVLTDAERYIQPAWSVDFNYADTTVNDLRRGDVIQYTLVNDKVDRIKIIVKADNVGPIRMDGATLQRSGNMVADIISVAENGRTALVHYISKEASDTYQTMLVNGSVYRYDSEKDEVYNSSTADLRSGDRVLINSFWWSPKAVVIFR